MNTLEFKTAQSNLTTFIPKFAKMVAPIYAMLKWEWSNNPTPAIPDTTDIESMLWQLVFNLKEDRAAMQHGSDKIRIARCGGLEVIIHESGYYEMKMSISLHNLPNK